MMLWDGSPHRWFGPESVPCCLMAAIDDATGKVLALRFVPQESAWAYLKLLEEVSVRWGVPSTAYQECHTIHQRSDDFWSLEEELAGRQDPTQVGRCWKPCKSKGSAPTPPRPKVRWSGSFARCRTGWWCCWHEMASPTSQPPMPTSATALSTPSTTSLPKPHIAPSRPGARLPSRLRWSAFSRCAIGRRWATTTRCDWTVRSSTIMSRP